MKTIRDTAAAMARAVIAALPGEERVTYRVFVRQQFNPTTGKNVDVFHDVHMPRASTLCTAVSVAEMARVGGGAGLVQLGDVRFTIPAQLLRDGLTRGAAGRLSTSDAIVRGRETYRVITGTESLGGVYLVYARLQT